MTKQKGGFPITLDFLKRLVSDLEEDNKAIKRIIAMLQAKDLENSHRIIKIEKEIKEAEKP